MRIFVACLALLIPFECLASPNAVVVSEHRLATLAGAQILKQGGNAIDAAVAVGYALAVVNSCCGNLGGGGFMTIHFANGKNIFLNFRERAPLKATAEMFLHASETASVEGYLAVATPGTVLGLDTALKRYGTMSREKVMAPAIALAEHGYQVTAYQANQFADNVAELSKDPNVAHIFLRSTKPLKAGEILVQTTLAKNLKMIAKHGPDAFYKGPISAAIIKASNRANGLLTQADFSNYTVRFEEPITCNYRGYDIISAAPPSSGGITLCEMLNILENFPLAQLGYNHVDTVRFIIEAMRYGFIDRNKNLGDPDFVNNPIQQLLSKSYARKISDRIIKMSLHVPQVSLDNNELSDTTHYSIVDKAGNAVAVTYTLNGFFGAQVIAKETGFFLNNEMDDFATKPRFANKFGLVHSEANAIAGGKRPLSSMAPTIILRDGKLVMVLGSPGGPRIITAILLTILNIFDFNMQLQQAIDAPRYHFQADPNLVYLEPKALNLYIELYLEFFNYHFKHQPYWSAVEAIIVDPISGRRIGANDKRRPDGAAISIN